MRGAVGKCVIELTQGDITGETTDAIVNAANSRLAGGGGVDGAIHRAGGRSIMEETRRRYPKGCPTGQAVVTSAGNLSAKFVIHAVGPVWRGGESNEENLLKQTYVSCLEQAIKHDCQSVSFPAISSGAYGYPRDLAARHALEAVSEFLHRNQQPETVRFVLFDAGAYGVFCQALETLLG